MPQLLEFKKEGKVENINKKTENQRKALPCNKKYTDKNGTDFGCKLTQTSFLLILYSVYSICVE